MALSLAGRRRVQESRRLTRACAFYTMRRDGTPVGDIARHAQMTRQRVYAIVAREHHRRMQVWRARKNHGYLRGVLLDPDPVIVEGR